MVAYRQKIFPRILPLSTFDDFWKKSMDRKARNQYRKFEKMGGIVRQINPGKYSKEIFECNMSKAKRQGRKLPKSYTDYDTMLKSMMEPALGAFIDGKLVGYAFLCVEPGAAKISRFIVHANYQRFCVSEGLMVNSIRYLLSKGIRRVQYGQWGKYHKSLNKFLEHFGFEKTESYKTHHGKAAVKNLVKDCLKKIVPERLSSIVLRLNWR